MSAKILVADDDYDNRTIIKEVLEAAGYQVVEAVNGLEAVEKAMAEKPAMILMDLSMPKLNGWEAAQKRIPEIAGPHIRFTAHALAGDDVGRRRRLQRLYFKPRSARSPAKSAGLLKGYK